MESGAIPNSAITASSQDLWATAAHGRLNGARFWTPSPLDAEPWIQADIGYLTNVSGVITQGNGGISTDNWVTSLKVSTSVDTEHDTLVFIQAIDTGTDKVNNII